MRRFLRVPGLGNAPRVGVSRSDAEALCAARGARLCRELEWEHACRGVGGASYPLWPDLLADRCNTAGTQPQPAGSIPACRSNASAFDMSGNVAEWTASMYVRGDAFDEGNPKGRCSNHVRSDGEATPKVGFRCCSEPRP